MSDVAEQVSRALEALIGQDDCPGVGIAVSGGSDSLALMLILAQWSRSSGIPLRAVTVDHGLRPEAAAEARQVAAQAAQAGLPHETLRWTGWDGQGNLQDQARRARYRLIAGWAEGHGLYHVALGHSHDDQAETVLMRLARGAGVDGLSAIPPRRRIESALFLRPMLGVTRADLQDWLQARGHQWVSDPSNEDARFDRIKARQALAALAPLGVDADGLVQVAKNMAEARKALNWFTYLSARAQVLLLHGDVVLDRAQFRTLPDEIQRRLIAHSLRWISGAEYPPRRRPLEKMLQAIDKGLSDTLHGVRVVAHGSNVHLTREYAAVSGVRTTPGALWDGRWMALGAAQTGQLYVAALGEAGIAQCPDWRAMGLPRASVLASPAIWSGADLIAAPLAGLGAGWRLVMPRGEEDFFAALIAR